MRINTPWICVHMEKLQNNNNPSAVWPHSGNVALSAAWKQINGVHLRGGKASLKCIETACLTDRIGYRHTVRGGCGKANGEPVSRWDSRCLLSILVLKALSKRKQEADLCTYSWVLRASQQRPLMDCVGTYWLLRQRWTDCLSHSNDVIVHHATLNEEIKLRLILRIWFIS